MSATEGSNEQTEAFLQTLFEPGDLIGIRPIETWIQDGKKRSRVDHKGIRYRHVGGRNRNGVWVSCGGGTTGTANVFKRVEERARRERTNTFFSVCPRVGGDGRYDLAWQIRTVRCLWSDVDDCTYQEALKRCEEAGLPPSSIIVHSGNGVHLYWLLDEPYMIDDVDEPLPVLTEFIDRGPGEKKKARKYIAAAEADEKLYLDIKRNVPPIS